MDKQPLTYSFGALLRFGWSVFRKSVWPTSTTWTVSVMNTASSIAGLSVLFKNVISHQRPSYRSDTIIDGQQQSTLGYLFLLWHADDWVTLIQCARCRQLVAGMGHSLLVHVWVNWCHVNNNIFKYNIYITCIMRPWTYCCTLFVLGKQIGWSRIVSKT